VPGLGPARRATLLRQFGSLRKLTAATVEQIAETPGFGQVTAAGVYAALHRGNGTAAAGPAGTAEAAGGDRDNRGADDER
jgi:excinuclease ABC subunit C